jgi:hypothetical protein
VAALVGAAVAGAWSRPPHDRVAAGLGVAAGLAAIAAATALVFQRVASRPSAAGDLDQIRVNHVLVVFLVGVAAMLIALSIGTSAVIVLHAKNPAQTLAAALGPVGTLIGTLAGAVAGHHLEMSARSREETPRRKPT